MDLNTITVQDFKDLFFRDFPYLNVWVTGVSYIIDDEVYYDVNELFYKCTQATSSELPTNASFWDSIADSVFNYVLDADIQKAFDETKINFNQALFSTDAEIQLAFLYVSAHFLVLDLRRSSQGINSTGDYTAQSQSVGNVSETKHIPEKILNNPIFQLYTTTSYGMKYLNLVMPRLIGRVNSVRGATNA